MKTPTIVTIAGSDPSSGAGIQADIKTCQKLGVFCTTVITAVTVQNTKGVKKFYSMSALAVTEQINAVMGDIAPKVWKTGMLVNKEIIKVVIDRVKKNNIRHLIVDPVLISSSGKLLLEINAIEILKTQLIPLATILTPNIPEAETLAGIKILSIEQMKEAAKKLYAMGAKYVVLKGGHLKSNNAVDIFFDGTAFVELKSKRVDTKNTHGTGCTFSAAIAAFLARDFEPIDAVKKAKQFVTNALLRGKNLTIGHGIGPLNHF